MSTDTQIAVMGTKMENIEKQITEINNKLDRTFVTKQELVNLEQRVSQNERTLGNISARLWGVIVIVLAEIIRFVINFIN